MKARDGASKRLVAGLVATDVVAVTFAVWVTRAMRDLRAQSWFWAPDWLAGEHEASADIALTRTLGPMSGEDFLRKLASDEHREQGDWATA